MALDKPFDDATLLSSDHELADTTDYHQLIWKMTEDVLEQRAATLTKSFLSFERDLDNTVKLLQKVFVDKEADFSTMEASMQLIVQRFSRRCEALSHQAKLITRTASPGQTHVDTTKIPEVPRPNKRNTESDDQSNSSKRHKSTTGESSQQGSPEMADLAREQWEMRKLHDRQNSAPSVYIMPDIIPKVPRAEVEFRYWVFQYPAFGNGYFILKCHWTSCTQSKSFTRPPFENGQAMQHFNNPCHNHGKEKFSEIEIMRTFALQVEDANEAWIGPSNMMVSRPTDSPSESQTGSTKRPRGKATAPRSTTKALTRKPPNHNSNIAGPFIHPSYDTTTTINNNNNNYLTSPMMSILPVSEETYIRDDQMEAQGDPTLPEIRVLAQ